MLKTVLLSKPARVCYAAAVVAVLMTISVLMVVSFTAGAVAFGYTPVRARIVRIRKRYLA